jgi:D,D-heptose 1,7-bisphosphate phosphatase
MTAATLRQAVVLVGGRGTRLGSLTVATPKPLLEVGGRPFLAWLLRELCRYGVEQVLLLAGFGAERVREAVPELGTWLPRALDLQVSEEPEPAGTGGALHHARAHLDERFLLLNGDSIFDANLARLLADAAADPPDVVGRLLLRPAPDASRAGVVRLAGDRVLAFLERPTESGATAAAIMHAGIAVLSRGIVGRLAPNCSLERDVLPKLGAEGWLRGTVGEGFFIDIGVPADFSRAQADLPQKFGARPALVLDRDGVLNVNHGYVGSRERFDWVEGAQAAVCAACDRGWHVFVATNQSGVARGYFAESAVGVLLAWMAETLRAAGGTIDDWRACPHHPDGTVAGYAKTCACRKPAPGMLLDLMRAWRLSPQNCVMVGDSPSDLAAAQAAGMPAALFSGGNLLPFIVSLVDRRPALVA